MTSTPRFDQYSPNITLLAWLRIAAVWSLAIAMASGALSLQSQLKLPELIECLAEPRYGCLLFSCLTGISSRLKYPMPRSSLETATILLLWLAFGTYSIVNTSRINADLLSWGGAEPIGLTLLTLVTTWLLLDTRDQAIQFVIASVAIISIVAVGFLVSAAVVGGPYPIHPFYASRTFFVGSIFAMYLVHVLKGRPLTAVVMAAASCVVFYAGLLSIMRAATAFYFVSILATIPLLLARRQALAIGISILIPMVTYGIHWHQNAVVIHDKVARYQNITPESFQPTDDAVSSELCRSRIMEAAGSVPIRPGEDKYSCNNVFRIYDVDARIRLVLHAIETNKSPLYGSGLGSYRFIEASRSDFPVSVYKYPHNILADLLHSSGLIAVGLILATIGLGIASCLRDCFRATEPIAILAAIPVFAGLSALVGGDLYDARFLWITPLVVFALCESSVPNKLHYGGAAVERQQEHF